MALHFQCFFCNRIVPVYREDETKFVSCPDCGARIDVDPDMAVSATEAKGCSCGGCLAFLIVLALVGGFIYSMVSQKDFSRRRRRTHRPHSTKSNRPRPKYYKPDNATAMRFINDFITSELGKIANQHYRPLFAIPENWKDDPRKFNAQLRRVYQREWAKYRTGQLKLPTILSTQIWRSLQRYRFSNQADFAQKVKLRCQRILESHQRAENRQRYPNISNLAYYLRTHLFTNANLPPDSSLQDAILNGKRFTAYDTLFIPAATNALFWDWSIGTHYRFTERKVRDIRPTDTILLAWEKIPFADNKKKYHFVILSNGKVDKWTNQRLMDKLRRK